MAFACCLGGQAVAQTSAPPVFVRLDKNGDGRLTRDEVPNAQNFAAADANKDVAVTLDEFRRHLGHRQNQATAPKTPDSVSQPATNQSGLFALLQRMPIALNVKQVPGYAHGRVFDPQHPKPNPRRGLLATRTIEVSPLARGRWTTRSARSMAGRSACAR